MCLAKFPSRLVLGKDVVAYPGYRMGLVCGLGDLGFAGSLCEGTLLQFGGLFVAAGWPLLG